MARYIFVPPASRELLDRIASGLPDYFPRADVGKWTNGLFSAGYLENLAVEGRGPKACFIGKKCVITKEAFMEWIERTYYQGEANGDIERDGDVPEGPAAEPQKS